MGNPDRLRKILHSQDPDKVEAFIQWTDSFIKEISESDIPITHQPFNKNTEEYKQILSLQSSAKNLINSLSKCSESHASKRLSHYLQSNNLDNEIHQVLRIYSATNYALNHQQRTSTRGRVSLLSETEKSKLR